MQTSVAQIKKDTSLRKAILQAAITGQLISSCHSEFDSESPAETGKELLDKIIEERNNKLLAEWEEALKKNPKAKKPEPIVASEIDEEEIPFEIPENWCWCRLGELGTFKKGPFGSSLTKAMFVPKSDNSIKVYEQKNAIKKDYTLGEYYITRDYYKKSMTGFTVYPKDIIVSCAGTIGETYIIPDVAPIGIINQALMIMRISELISSKFFLYLFDYLIKNQSRDYSKGTAINNIPPFSVFKNLIIPLPPLSVQNAIVAKLEQVLPLVDAYENAILQKEELKSALPDKVKKAILQEAITGQLTENWRKSATIKENGKQLLDRIIEERNAKALADWKEALKKNPKAKKPVPVVASEIDEEEIPFEVPESWCWCHLGEICNEIKRGKSPKYVDRSDYLAFAQKCNVKTGGIDLSLALYLDEKSIDRYSEEDNLIQGDVVINSTGGGTMGRVGYYETKVPEGIKGVYPDSHVTVIRSIGNINQRYLYYILKHNQPVLEDCGTGSTNQTELKPGVLANFVIPLPPLEEQEEIVKKVEELLSLCK